MRKVIKVAVAAVPCEPTAHPEFITYVALCNDGVVFTGGYDYKQDFNWHELPPIPQPEIADVVMPKVGDAIFVRNHEDLGYEHYVFDKFEKMNVLCLDGGATWDLWRLNLSDPWRDASGKVVEV